MPSVFVLSYSGTPLHCAAARRGAAASEAAASVSAQASVVGAGGRRRRRRGGASGAEASGAPRERIAAGVRRVGAATARPKVRSTQQNVELMSVSTCAALRNRLASHKRAQRVAGA